MVNWTTKCDLCNKPKNESLSYWDGWLSFLFCTDCEKNHEEECNHLMIVSESERIRKGLEQR